MPGELSEVQLASDREKQQTQTPQKPGCIRGLWVTRLQTSDSLPHSQLLAQSQIRFPSVTFSLLYKIAEI